VEFGSGSSAKTPLVIDAIRPTAYVPIDISGEFLRESARTLSVRFPALPIFALEGDFLKPLTLPDEIADTPRVGFFPGSTIGNLTPASAIDLLRTMAKTLGHGSQLLIGIDRIKAEDVLVRAYDDRQGVTASFNLNLLERINRELGGTIPIECFRHLAKWNSSKSRIEMHLEAVRDVVFKVQGQRFAMDAGETIHTENSHKYGLADARLLFRAGGWSPIVDWTDEKELFSVFLCEALSEPFAP
jgi:L-histidine N-alpha-methyltransferase